MTWMLEGYFKLPVWVQNAAISAYGLRLRMLRYGEHQRKVLNRLLANEHRSLDETLEMQRVALAKVLTHAATTVPFYRKQELPRPSGPAEAEDVLKSWPVLEKSAVQEAGRAILSEALEPRTLVEIHTGGTTGRALAIWCDRKALQTNYAFFERLKRWAGGNLSDKVATFAGRTIVSPTSNSAPYWRHNLAAHQLLLSSYHISPSSLEDYIEALERFQPALIDSYPSSIEPLAKHVLSRGGSSISPKAVITSSETLFPEARATIESAFGCSVFDYYGSAEMVTFITQCEEGRYHSNPEYGFLEILRSDGSVAQPGEEGEVVATGFVNRAMPLIRYRLGDLAVQSSDGCGCGRPYPVIARITGRVDDVIVTPDGRRVGRLDPIFKAVDSLHEARIVQTHVDRIRLELVTAPGFTSRDREELVKQIRLRLGSAMVVDVEDVPSLPRTGAGKLQTVVSDFGQDR